ncbi:DUF6455 family protein [uncultured Pelagimonas sp.]|uniref:DUF6455 family protein n=1 Tax=uncultured Pelagimonas sp. TaxID=1618102 RepID=UPI00260F3C47|nr:DUF6455 family protein [uncultured Pelagimonas sp.]
MQSRETLKRHASLFDDMACAVGLDLEDEVLTGRLPIPDLDDAVLRCTGCKRPEACADWLKGDTAAAAETPPKYCRNASLFAKLKRI